jgi:UDP-glucose 4-epimerase
MYSGDFTIAVISSSVSPTLTIGPIPAFTRRLNSGLDIKISDTSRDYLNPHSCSEAIDIASRPDTKLDSVAIGSGVSTHTSEIAKFVCQILGIELDLPTPTPSIPGDPKQVKFEPSISLRNLGWEPKNVLLSDIERVVSNFISSGKLERQHHV